MEFSYSALFICAFSDQDCLLFLSNAVILLNFCGNLIDNSTPALQPALDFDVILCTLNVNDFCTKCKIQCLKTKRRGLVIGSQSLSMCGNVVSTQ
jgi:hypothetical protein